MEEAGRWPTCFSARWQAASTTCTTAFVALLVVGVLSSDVCNQDDCAQEWRLIAAASGLCVGNLLAVAWVRCHELTVVQTEDSIPAAKPVARYSVDERSSMM